MRTRIREAIRKTLSAVCGGGVEFHHGFLTDMAKGGFHLPCVWLCPLDLAGKSGRQEGIKDYAGTMYMLKSIEGLTADQQDEAWDCMEAEAMRILASVIDADDDIITVENIKGYPDAYALTGYNSISLKVTFTVKANYCADRE